MRGKEIRNAFLGLVGVSPSSDGLTPIIPLSLLGSESGYYLGPEIDSLLGMDTIFKASSAMDNYSQALASIPVFSSLLAYDQGTKVRIGDDVYWSKADAPIGSSLDDEDTWEATSIFGEYIRNKMESAALQAVEAVRRANGMEATGSQSLLVASPIYGGIGRRSDTIQKSSRFVGYSIGVSSGNTAFKISRLSTHLSEAQTIRIYLYMDGVSAPLKYWDVEHTVGGNVEEHTVDPYTHYNGNDITGRQYKIGYYEDDLTGFAINKPLKINKNCKSCDPKTWRLNQKNAKYISIEPFFVPNEELDLISRGQWGSEVEDYEISESSFGINVWITLSCDLTEFFIANRAAFVPPYVARLKANFLREISITRRGNSVSNQTRSIMQQIGGNAKTYNQDKGPKILDIDNETEFDEAVADTVSRLSGFDGICFPKLRRNSVGRIVSM